MGKILGGDLQQGRFLILERDSYLRWDLRMTFQSGAGALPGTAVWENDSE